MWSFISLLKTIWNFVCFKQNVDNNLFILPQTYPKSRPKLSNTYCGTPPVFSSGRNNTYPIPPHYVRLLKHGLKPVSNMTNDEYNAYLTIQ